MQTVEVKRNWPLMLALFGFVALAGFIWSAISGSLQWTAYGATVGLLLGAKLVLSLLPPKQWPEASNGKVALVIPMFNEDPAILERTLASIAAQTRLPDYVRIIDDGSTNPPALELAQRWCESVDIDATAVWQENAGKREAMARAFRELGDAVTIFVCVDSDTVLDSRAIEEGLRPLSDPSVAAVTGTVVALNHKVGLLPRLLDLRYANAFLYERAAYSRLGSVLCVCGSLAFWRAEIVMEHLDDFLGQRFLGENATYGDDRHMTNLSLLHGKVVLAHHAIAQTAVPERGNHLIRQQARWGRSFFRECIWALRNLTPRRMAWWLTLIESGSWAGFTIGLLTTLFVLPVVTGDVMIVHYLVWITLTGWARSVHLFSIRRSDVSRWQQLQLFALAPLYGVIHVLVLLPLRIYSLVTLRSHRGWGTRQNGAEVRLEVAA